MSTRGQPRILAVDTNSPAGSAALLEGEELLGEINWNSPQTHSERLLAAVDFLLTAQKWTPDDLDGFALAAGPGSFTGIRIGMSTVKALALAADKPVAPVSNLSALAFKLRRPAGRLLCPLIDARKQEVYSGLFEYRDRNLRELVPQGVYPPDALFARLPAHRVIHFLGTGTTVFRGKIQQYFRDKARFPQRTPFIAYEVGLLGRELLARGGGIDCRDLEPLYIRKSQAEEKP